MAVFRINKDKNYTVMSNYHFKDKNLSYKAKGLLSVMLSLPDDWDYTERGLVSISKDNIDGIRTALKELEKYGYLKRERVRNSKGMLKETKYDIYEKPILEFPILEKPILEKPTQLNTKEINTKEINNIYIVQFEKFYDIYPRKETKKKVEQWFIKNKPNDEQFNMMINKLEEFKKCKQWQNKQYIPMPITWLNQERWLDEIIIEEEITDYKNLKKNVTVL